MDISIPKTNALNIHPIFKFSNIADGEMRQFVEPAIAIISIDSLSLVHSSQIIDLEKTASLRKQTWNKWTNIDVVLPKITLLVTFCA